MSQTIYFGTPTGQAITAKLFSVAAMDTLAPSGTATELTNHKGQYSVALSGLATGAYNLKAYISGVSQPLADWFVNITSGSGTFIATDSAYDTSQILAISGSVSIVIPPAVAQNSQTPSMITIIRGDQLSVALPVLGTITGYTKLMCTAKLASQIQTTTNTDAQAVFQVQAGVGLIVLNGVSTGIAAGDASLTVTNASTGETTLVLNADATSVIPLEDLVWDVQYWDAGGQTHSPVSGTIEVSPDVTQSI